MKWKFIFSSDFVWPYDVVLLKEKGFAIFPRSFSKTNLEWNFFFAALQQKDRSNPVCQCFIPVPVQMNEIASVSLGKFWITTAKVFLKVRREKKIRTSWQTNYVIEFQKICSQVRRSGYGKQKKRNEVWRNWFLSSQVFLLLVFKKTKCQRPKKKAWFFLIN